MLLYVLKLVMEVADMACYLQMHSSSLRAHQLQTRLSKIRIASKCAAACMTISASLCSDLLDLAVRQSFSISFKRCHACVVLL